MRMFLAAAAFALAVSPVAAQTIVIPNTPDQPGQAETSRVTAGTYAVDPAHTQVSWAVNHLGFSVLEGLLGASEGTITIDPAAPADTEVDVTFHVEDMAVTYADFATHLASPDFFDAAQHPTARFVSTSVTPGENDTATIQGDLTIKGETRPVTIEAVFVGAGTNPMDQKLNFGFNGTATIKRSDFGLGAYAPAVSDEVRLDIHAAFAAQ